MIRISNAFVEDPIDKNSEEIERKIAPLFVRMDLLKTGQRLKCVTVKSANLVSLTLADEINMMGVDFCDISKVDLHCTLS